MYRPAVMPELKGADRDPLDGAAGITDGDVLADAEGVLGEKEQARDDVLDKGLRPESERDADHSRASEQWRDVDPERGEAHERRDRIKRHHASMYSDAGRAVPGRSEPQAMMLSPPST